MCPVHKLEVELLDNLSNELVQLDLWKSVHDELMCVNDLPLRDRDLDMIVVQHLRS